jgi:hypothetical protein
MPVPGFTECGLLPSGVHACTLQEAEQALCLNARRAEIWAGLLGFIGWTQELPPPDALLIDGSYVTDKPLPGDVDVVVDITSLIEVEQQRWIAAWNGQHEFVKLQFNVDFYPFVIGEGHDFSAFFQYVRVEEALRRGISPLIRKGILRVAP